MVTEAEPGARKAYSVSMTGRPLLEYETPRKPEPGDAPGTMLRVGQRLIFAVGAGLLIYGVLAAWVGRTHDAPDMAGWGAALCVLGSPWGWRRVKRAEN
jgi:hypothetical protein